MSTGQIPLLPDPGLTRTRARRPRRHPAAEDLPVARVALLTPLPHLDREFDYEVPEKLTETALPGVRVRVRLAGRLVDGFVLERVATSQRELQPLVSAHGPAVLTPEVAELCRAVADRYAGTLADVLRFAVPPRHARAEKRAVTRQSGADESGADESEADRSGVSRVSPPPIDRSGWSAYTGGDRLLDAVGGSEPVRALWAAGPGEPIGQRIAELVRAVRDRAGGALVIVPDAADLDRIAGDLVRAGIEVTRLEADLGPEARYRAFLDVLSGVTRVVVGTRAAVFAPVVDLALIVIWDDGDDSLAEPQAPAWHAREVAALRSSAAAVSLVLGGHPVTLEAARMAASGWLAHVALPRPVLRARMPRIHAAADLVADPARTGSRIPSVALDLLRAARGSGPLLVSVPRAGYLPVLACQACREPVGCPKCARPMQAQGPDRAPSCAVHGVVPEWRCAICGGEVLRAAVVGVRRTAEEFGRALPGLSVVTSSGQTPVRTVTRTDTLVVATPGAEPDPGPHGYGALLLLDAAAALSRPGLRVAEEVLRRWFDIAALVRPAARGGRVLVVGEPDIREVQALIRWDPLGYAQRELGERTDLHLPPAVRLAQLTGPALATAELAEAIADELGPAILRRSGPLPGPGPDSAATWLLAVSFGDGPRLARALARAQSVRSARRAVPVRAHLDPVGRR